MIHIDRILFLTDFSVNAANALTYTLNFAKKISAAITIFHTYQIPLTGMPIAGAEVPIENIENQIKFSERSEKERIEDLLRQTKLIAPDIACTYLLREGLLIDHLSDIIKEERIDIIFMGTKGAGKVAGLLFDTVAGKVIEKAACPVFVIPDHASYSPLKNILYASDFEKSDLSVIENIAKLAEIFEGEITIINVSDEENNLKNISLKEFEPAIRKNISFQKLKFVSVMDKDVVHAIDEYAEEKNVDLVVMNSHKRNLFQKIYDRSLTKKLSYQTHIPLLAFHTNGAE